MTKRPHKAKDAYLARRRHEILDASPYARRVDWASRITIACSDAGLTVADLSRLTGRDEAAYLDRLRGGQIVNADAIVLYLSVGLPVASLLPEAVMTPDVCHVVAAMTHQIVESELLAMGDFLDNMYGEPPRPSEAERLPVDKSLIKRSKR